MVARRRIISSVDTSDSLANLVLGILLVLALAGALLVFFTSERGGQTDDATVTDASGAGAASPAADDDAGAADGAPQQTGPTTVPAAPPESATALQPRGQRDEQAPPAEADGAAAGGTAAAEGADTTGGGDVATTQCRRAVTVGDPDAGDRDVPPAEADDPDRVLELNQNDAPLDVHTVEANLDDDQQAERVWAAIVCNQVQVRVERVDADGRWAVVDEAMGGIADDLVGLWVEDLTGDGRPEIHTRQWVGAAGESVTLWSWGNGRLGAMQASGGCWDGANTFGVIGALVVPGEVWAICEAPSDDPPQPSMWSTAIYRWRDGTWTFIEEVDVRRPPS